MITVVAAITVFVVMSFAMPSLACKNTNASTCYEHSTTHSTHNSNSNSNNSSSHSRSNSSCSTSKAKKCKKCKHCQPPVPMPEVTPFVLIAITLSIFALGKFL